MTAEWLTGQIPVFIGFVMGIVGTVVAQVAATKWTRDRHELTVGIGNYGGLHSHLPEYSESRDGSRGIEVTNSGHFVERDIDVRLRILLATRPDSQSIELSGPQLIFAEQYNLHEENSWSPYLELERVLKYRIEFLAPKQVVRLDLVFPSEILEINVVVASEHSVSSADWQIENYRERRREAMRLIDEELGINWESVRAD